MQESLHDGESKGRGKMEEGKYGKRKKVEGRKKVKGIKE